MEVYWGESFFREGIFCFDFGPSLVRSEVER